MVRLTVQLTCSVCTYAIRKWQVLQLNDRWFGGTKERGGLHKGQQRIQAKETAWSKALKGKHTHTHPTNKNNSRRQATFFSTLLFSFLPFSVPFLPFLSPFLFPFSSFFYFHFFLFYFHFYFYFFFFLFLPFQSLSISTSFFLSSPVFLPRRSPQNLTEAAHGLKQWLLYHLHSLSDTKISGPVHTKPVFTNFPTGFPQSMKAVELQPPYYFFKVEPKFGSPTSNLARLCDCQ